MGEKIHMYLLISAKERPETKEINNLRVSGWKSDRKERKGMGQVSVGTDTSPNTPFCIALALRTIAINKRNQPRIRAEDAEVGKMEAKQ